jgi:hypothetical protein
MRKHHFMYMDVFLNSRFLQQFCHKAIPDVPLSKFAQTVYFLKLSLIFTDSSLQVPKCGSCS